MIHLIGYGIVCDCGNVLADRDTWSMTDKFRFETEYNLDAAVYARPTVRCLNCGIKEYVRNDEE